MVEDTALKAAGGNTFAGSIPVFSVLYFLNVFVYFNTKLTRSNYKLLYLVYSLGGEWMDDHTYNNWVKIKETFEASENTDNMFYKRACEIVKTKKDPLTKYLEDEK